MTEILRRESVGLEASEDKPAGDASLSASRMCMEEPTMKREPLLQFFEYSHLPEHLQEHSKPFWVLAHHLCNRLPESAERTAAIRKLLEAKDCAVRASIYDETKGEVHERVPDHFFKTRPIQ